MIDFLGIDFLGQYYLLIKGLHIIAIISWMAGLLYLPRLFVYHVNAPIGSDQSETFKIMERRLMMFIMNPAMVLSWFFGGLMIAANPDLFAQGWFHVKLTFVIAMTITHKIFLFQMRRFARDENKKSARYYKIWNEVPTIFMIIIVLMAVAKPF